MTRRHALKRGIESPKQLEAGSRRRPARSFSEPLALASARQRQLGRGGSVAGRRCTGQTARRPRK